MTACPQAGAVRVASSGTLEPELEELSEATPFDLASLTKPLVTAWLLVLLEQSGTIDPAAAVGRWLPELGDAPAGRASLLSLARHEAGLAAWAPLYVEASSLEGYLSAIARLPPAAGPGGPLYSDLGYILLGAALERAAGLGLDRLFHERIAVPLGLRRTGFASSGNSLGDAAATERGNVYERTLAGEAGAGHGWRTDVIRGAVHDANAHGLGGVAGHAGLFGPVAEVARLVRELLRPTTLPIDERGRDRLLGLPPGGGERTVGFVVARGSKAAAGILPDAAPGHTGFTGTSIWLDPQADRFYVLLANRVHPRVPGREFHLVRRGFHRLARRLGV